jgi:hypothetical protein
VTVVTSYNNTIKYIIITCIEGSLSFHFFSSNQKQNSSTINSQEAACLFPFLEVAYPLPFLAAVVVAATLPSHESVPLPSPPVALLLPEAAASSSFLVPLHAPVLVLPESPWPLPAEVVLRLPC